MGTELHEARCYPKEHQIPNTTLQNKTSLYSREYREIIIIRLLIILVILQLSSLQELS